jgi:hypothetical protein
MAYTRDVVAFSLWNFVCGILIPIGDIPLTTYLQQSVPSAYRGRVSSVEGTFATGVMPIGMGLGGRLQEAIGTLMGFVLIGLGMTLSCLLGLLDRTFRRIRLDPTAL